MARQINRTAPTVKAAAAMIDSLIKLYSDSASRALLAAELIRLGWLPRKARVTTNANNSYLHTARHLSPEQHQCVTNGLATLAHFHNHVARTSNGASY
jgi:hypothetical protein